MAIEGQTGEGTWPGPGPSQAAQALARAMEAVTRERRLGPVAEAILDEVVGAFGLRTVAVFLASDDKRELRMLRLRGERGIRAEQYPQVLAYDAPFVTALVARTRTPQVIPEQAEFGEPLADTRALRERMQLGGVFAFPLLAFGRLVGVLVGALPPGRVFSEAEVEALHGIARVAAIGLANAEAFEAERRLRTRLDNVRQASLAMGRARDVPAIVRVVVEQARRLAFADVAAAGLSAEPDGPLASWTYAGFSDEETAALGAQPLPTQVLAQLRARRQPWRVDAPRADPVFRSLAPPHPPLGAFLAVPLVSRRRTLGWMYVANREARPFTNEDEKTLEMLGRQAAITVENARGRERLENELRAREKLEASLRQREESLRAAQRIAHLGSWEWDVVNDHLAWSDELYRIFGTRPEMFEPSYAGFLRFVHPEDRERVSRAVFDSFNPGAPPYAVEHRIVRDDGTERYIFESGQAWLENGQPARMVGVAQDITERKKREEALRESEQRFLQTFEFAPIGIALLDPDGRHVRVNRAYAALAGATVLRLEELGWLDLLPPDERDAERETLRALAQGRLPRSRQDRHLVRADGAVRAVAADLSAVRDEKGRLVNLVVQLEDAGGRRGQDERLRTTEKQLREIFENAPIGIAVFDLEGRFTRVNPAYAELTGYALEELCGMSFQDVTLPDDLVQDRAVRQELLDGRRSRARRDKHYVRKDGSVIDVVVNLSLLRDRDGRPLSFVSQVEDVTERRRAESALRENEERLRLMFEDAPFGFALLRPDGRFVRVNRAFAELLGYTPEELESRSFAEVTYPEDRAEDARQVRDLLAGKIPRLLREKRYVRKDGTVIDALVSAAVLRGANGEPVQLIANVGDITARKARERALRESEERFRQTIDNAPIGMAIVTLDGTLTRVNAALAEIVGYSREELTKLRFHDITHPDDLETDLALAKDLVEGRIPRYRLEKRYVHRNGSIVNVVLHGSVVRDERGRPVHFIAQVEDITDRKKREEALRRSEAQFRSVIELAPEGVFVHRDGRFVFVNPAFVKLMGYDRADELVGRPIGDIIAPEAREEVAARVEASVRARDTAGRWEVPAVRRDGTPVHLETVALFVDFEGAPSVAVLSRDVTERKRAEEALRRSEAQFRSVIEHAPEAIFVHQDGKFVFANPATVASLGYAREDELLGRPVLDVVHPDDRELVTSRIRTVLTGEPSKPRRIRLLRQDGTDFDAETMALQIDFGGRPSIVVLSRDVTERQRAARERERLVGQLAEERRWLETVLEYAPVGVALVESPSGAPMRLNRYAERLLGRPHRPERGIVQYAQLIRGSRGEALAWDVLPLVRALRGESTMAADYVLARPDGAELPIRMSTAPLKDAGGHTVGAVGVFEDVSAQKEEERLREEWTSVIAHDLRQPVAIILAYAGLLERTRPTLSEKRKLEHIVAAARRLDRLIKDLLDWSRLEARRLALSPEALDVDTAIRAAAERTQRTYAGSVVEVNVAPDVPEIRADPARLDQVLDNLLSNAVKYGTPGTPVRVDARRKGGEVEVCVRNEGPGIPADQLPRLFSRFHRVGETRRVAGVGLGLYITRGLVEAHGGRIWAESVPGGVTSFCFTVPG